MIAPVKSMRAPAKESPVTRREATNAAESTERQDGPPDLDMISHYQRKVASYQDGYGITQQEAAAEVEKCHTAPHVEQRVLDCPANQVSWTHLYMLRKRDPDLALQRWEEIMQAARDELRDGHRGAKAFETDVSTPLDRARILVVREAICEDLKPQNGTERILIDAITQAHLAYYFWIERSMLFATLDSSAENSTGKKTGTMNTPRVTDFQSVDQAAAMADRFNKMFVRSLRAFVDLRRHAPTVIVENANQVNVG